MKYGRVIRFMRLSRRLKQIEVANIIGCENSLVHYENDCRALTFENLMRIADAIIMRFYLGIKIKIEFIDLMI